MAYMILKFAWHGDLAISGMFIKNAVILRESNCKHKQRIYNPVAIVPFNQP